MPLEEPADPRNPPLLHDITDSCRLLGGISRVTLYKLINTGQLRLVKIGARSYLLDDELRRYVNQLES